MEYSLSKTHTNTEVFNLLKGIVPSLNESCKFEEFHKKTLSPNSMVVFVSSTFTDTHKERNILFEKILPKLINLCNPLDLRVVIVDMCYGVRDENTDDHMTWIADEKEIIRCFRDSGSLAFLSLQGDKYGYRPIPKYIDKKMFEERLMTTTAGATSAPLAKEWYHLDENASPPVYVLRNLTVANRKIFWDKAYNRLLSLFREMPVNKDNSDLIIGRSVTEYETRKALNLSCTNMYWLHRHFTGGVSKVQDPKEEYRDVHDSARKSKFDNLITTMTSKLNRKKRIHNFNLPIESYINQDDIGKTYLKQWERVAYSILLEQLNIVIVRKKNWLENGCGIGKGNINGLELQEFIHHIRWANIKCLTFIGRFYLLAECVMKVYENSNNNGNDINNNNNKTGNKFCGTTTSSSTSVTSKFQGICMCIVGVSGSGKTALISKLAQKISEQDKLRGIDRPVIIRFCGTTTDSSNGLSLIHSICYQIRYLYDVDLTIPMSSDYETAVEYFQSLLAYYPVVLLVDSLDQLTNANEARTKISFLAGVRPHINTKIIVSCLSDEKDASTREWKYCYLCDTRLKVAEVARVTIPQLGGSDSNISDMIVTMMGSIKRRVTDDQLQFSLQQVSVEPTALYINLATRIMSTWKSYDTVTALVLHPTVVGIINQIIDSLEGEFGIIMTRCALGLMTFAVAGVSDNEMQDLLSLDDMVMDSVFQSSQPESRRLPLHVWLRLRGALEGLVVERDRGCLVWYHRQLKETAELRYSVYEKKHFHKLLGTYFSDIVDVSVRESRLIASQPLTWTEAKVWSSECVINHRRCVEGSYHLCHAELLVEAAIEICSIELICACAKIGEGFPLLDNITQLHRFILDTSITQNIDISTIRDKVRHYYSWLRRDMSTIVNNPVAFISASVTANQPLTSIARKNFNNYLKTYRRKSMPNTTMETSSYWSEGWAIGKTLGGLSDFNSIQLNLTGHSGGVTSVSFSPDGRTIVSGSIDNTVKIWNVKTCALLNTLQGHSKAVSSVNFSPDGQTIVSGSTDNTINIWDVKTGTLLNTLKGHRYQVTSVNFSPDGQTIVSGSSDNTVKVWDVETGNLLTTYVGHKRVVRSVNFSPDGLTIVSGSDDNTINVWDVKTGNVLITFEGHSSVVNSVSFSPDGQTIVSGSSDNTVKVWDVLTGNFFHTLKGHSNKVRYVNFSPDGKFIVSGAHDNMVKVWDVKTGNLLNTLEGHSNWVSSVNFSPDGKTIVSGSGDKTVKVWDVTTGNLSNTLVRYSKAVMSVNYSPDGQTIVSGSDDNMVKVWDVTTGNVLIKFKGHSGGVMSVSFSPDGQTIFSGSWDKTVKVWDVKTGNLLNTLEGHSKAVCSVNCSPDGKTIASGSGDYLAKVWDVKTGKVLNTLEGHSNWVKSVSFSPDGQTVVSGSKDNMAKVWNVKTGTLLYTLEGHSNCVQSVSFSPDGQTIVSGSKDKSINVWDVKTGNALITLIGHSRGVTSVNFSPDGLIIVSGSADNTIKIWDIKTGKVLNTLEGHSNCVKSVNFSPDGQTVVSGSDDKTLKVWDMKDLVMP